MGSKSDQACRHCMLGFTFFFMLGGCALIGVSIWILLRNGQINELIAFNPILLEYATYCVLAVGGISIPIGVWGCWGGRIHSKGFIRVFIFGLVLLVFIEIAASTLAFLCLRNFDQVVGSSAKTSLLLHFDSKTTLSATVTDAWNKLQGRMECCGFDNGYDYNNSYFANSTFQHLPWPSSCCTLSPSGVPVDLISCVDGNIVNANYTNVDKGCRPHIETVVTKYAIISGASALGLAFIQLILMFLACAVMRSMDRPSKSKTVSRPLEDICV